MARWKCDGEDDCSDKSDEDVLRCRKEALYLSVSQTFFLFLINFTPYFARAECEKRQCQFPSRIARSAQVGVEKNVVDVDKLQNF